MKTTTPVKYSVLRRALATVACLVAFAVMASIFTPERTRAGGMNDPWPGIPPKSIDYAPVHDKGSSTNALSDEPQSPSPTDAHEGLQSLGVIESLGYSLHIFATEGGPRYTIYETATGRECGALLTERQVHQAFPDLQLPTMEFNAGAPLMLVDPDSGLWW